MQAFLRDVAKVRGKITGLRNYLWRKVENTFSECLIERGFAAGCSAGTTWFLCRAQHHRSCVWIFLSSEEEQRLAKILHADC